MTRKIATLALCLSLGGCAALASAFEHLSTGVATASNSYGALYDGVSAFVQANPSPLGESIMRALTRYDAALAWLESLTGAGEAAASGDLAQAAAAVLEAYRELYALAHRAGAVDGSGVVVGGASSGTHGAPVVMLSPDALRELLAQ